MSDVEDDPRLTLARLICPLDYAIVPREPTREMLNAAAAAMSPGKRPDEWVSVRAKHRIRYCAMLAALEPPEPQPIDGGEID
jgi:hypothetical protein